MYHLESENCEGLLTPGTAHLGLVARGQRQSCVIKGDEFVTRGIGLRDLPLSLFGKVEYLKKKKRKKVGEGAQ